jgi:Zn-dependent protease/CBS domain-containing protein
MKWAWKIGTFSGIAVYVHTTFLLLLGWILSSHLLAGHGLGAGLQGVAFIVLLFSCVLLHEFGHALTAQRFGVPTRDITLYPIGGIARLQRIPRDPRQELLIAIAGPAVNIVIAAVLFLGLLAAGQPIDLPGSLRMVGGNLASKLMVFNLWLVAFNILPAFPMDGGRVLRAFLAERMEYGRATQIAANVGQAMAFVFGFLGLSGYPLLLFIALFVYLGAAEEAATVQAELAFRGVPVREAMLTRFATLVPGDPLTRATELLLAGTQHDFPVVENGATIGLLTRSALVSALAERGPDSPVQEAMQPAPPAVSPMASLESTFQRIRESEAQTVPVEENGQLVGLVTLENIGEFLMVRSALEQLRRHERGAAGGSPPGAAAMPAGSRWRAWLYGAGRPRARG